MIKSQIIVILILAQLISNFALAQESESRLSDKIVFGGNLGLQFGTVTYVEVAPTVGYKIFPKITAGVGATYIYQSDNRYDFKTSIYGGNLFTRFMVFKELFAHAEIEYLNLEFYNTANFDFERTWVESILIGGGYRQAIGQRASTYILVLWNLNESYMSPHSNPTIRIGFNF